MSGGLLLSIMNFVVSTFLVVGLLFSPASHHDPHPAPLPVQIDQFSASTPAEAAERHSKEIEARYELDHATALQIAQASAQRQSVVFTALSYLGTPYALWGSTHQSMDCSGLTMVSYASVGIPMRHYVPYQDDAAPIHLPAGQQEVGDLLVFDDQDHVAIYIGNGLLIEAPTEGIPTRIVPVAGWWDNTPYHVAQYLP